MSIFSCEPVAAAGLRQLNGTSAQWCVGKFREWQRHGTDRQTDRRTGITHKQPPERGSLIKLRSSIMTSDVHRLRFLRTRSENSLQVDLREMFRCPSTQLAEHYVQWSNSVGTGRDAVPAPLAGRSTTSDWRSTTLIKRTCTLNQRCIM